jgi:hypothetical protein
VCCALSHGPTSSADGEDSTRHISTLSTVIYQTQMYPQHSRIYIILCRVNRLWHILSHSRLQARRRVVIIMTAVFAEGTARFTLLYVSKWEQQSASVTIRHCVVKQSTKINCCNRFDQSIARHQLGKHFPTRNNGNCVLVDECYSSLLGSSQRANELAG